MVSPYTVLIDGVPVQCETADATLELIRTAARREPQVASRRIASTQTLPTERAGPMDQILDDRSSGVTLLGCL